MINQRQIETTIVNGLQEALGCPVIRQNQTAPIPDYPYVSYLISTPRVANNGTYGYYGNDSYAKPFSQVWSFTVQSDDCTESQDLAAKAHEWFELTNGNYLDDNNIVVERLMNITSRDNLLTIEYEYRNGFDVQFALMDAIGVEPDEYIEVAELTYE